MRNAKTTEIMRDFYGKVETLIIFVEMDHVFSLKSHTKKIWKVGGGHTRKVEATTCFKIN